MLFFRQSLPLAALFFTHAASAIPSLGDLSSRAQSSADLCGDYANLILPNTPWIVYNMLYNAAQMVGTQCTNYDAVTTSDNGTKEVLWSSVTNIDYVESTNNVPKGYSFVGLTQNLETKLSVIESIPAAYSWTRTNTTNFKGNICFDFMTNDIKGDSTSSSSHELMLWLQYEGGQLPIGWTNGPAATIDNLFGTSWTLYEDVNTDTGITVSTLMPTKQFEGSFSGDLKDWLLALADLGIFTESTYVNVGNAGTEFFYGNAVMNSTLGLQINLA
ncbi:Glycoside hydrolase, family 12 [Penicillium camemberti]|uniref:xyloglucan-specific endo-beta-1,4-glucanase n=1 Tax=Penicillium camemberti (strain FM 013) TaxID=1429867 RepID=A0A0G4PMZ9_PENC3|nr:Glycoside hydrolase, family 12 [Penicillium camemberti]